MSPVLVAVSQRKAVMHGPFPPPDGCYCSPLPGLNTCDKLQDEALPDDTTRPNHWPRKFTRHLPLPQVSLFRADEMMHFLGTHCYSLPPLYPVESQAQKLQIKLPLKTTKITAPKEVPPSTCHMLRVPSRSSP